MEGGSLPAWWDWYVFLRGFSTLAHFDANLPFSAMTSLPSYKEARKLSHHNFHWNLCIPDDHHTRHTMAPPLPDSPNPSLSSYCLTNDLTIAATSTIND